MIYTSNLKYRPDIDGLRAIAVLLVVAFHAFPSVIKGGFVGVDVFFVISGYLISTILLKSLTDNEFSIVAFYSRRIRRIFPALILVLASCLLFGWYSLTPNEFSRLGKNVAASAAFISNFSLWHEAGYFDVAAQKKILLHLWSLGVEEQFYIVWPISLWLCWKVKQNYLALTLIALLGSFILNIATVAHHRNFAFYHPGTRFWEILVGSTLATLSIQHRKFFERMPSMVSHVSSLLGSFLLVCGVVVLANTHDFPGWFALFPTVGTFLIIASGITSIVNRKLLTNPVLVYIGEISFPLYLWHWPLLSYITIVEGKEAPAVLRVFAVGLALLLAAFTFSIIEQPVRKGAVNARLGLLLPVSMLLFGCVGLFMYGQNGFPSRNPVEESFRKDNWSYGWKNVGCDSGLRTINSDCISNSEKQPEIVLIGDSHTQGVFLSLAELLPGKSIVRFGTYLPLFDTTVVSGPNDAQNSSDASRALWFSMSTKTVKTIIIGFRGVMRLTGTDFHEKNEGEMADVGVDNEPKVSRNVSVALARTMKSLSASGKRIIFIMDTPELGFDPQECLAIRPLHFSTFSPRFPCAVPRNEYESRNREYRSLVFATAGLYPEISILDLQDKLCDARYCWAERNNQMLYMDDNHLSIQGCNLLAKGLVDLLDPNGHDER